MQDVTFEYFLIMLGLGGFLNYCRTFGFLILEFSLFLYEVTNWYRILNQSEAFVCDHSETVILKHNAFSLILYSGYMEYGYFKMHI